MRWLGSVACLLTLTALSPCARGQERGSTVEARVAGYVDDDATYVARPYAAAHLLFGPVRAGVGYSADVISTASVDVVSRATRGVDEARHQVMADAAYLGDDGLAIGGSWTSGVEPDHESHGATLRVERDLDSQRLWHGAVVVGGSWAATRSVLDPRFFGEAFTGQLSIALARIFDPLTVARVLVDGSVTTGLQSSPYRTVRLGDWTARRSDGTDPDTPAWVFSGSSGIARERHPELRLRARVGVELVRELIPGVALATRLAGYGDDWGILAIDGAAELRLEPSRDLLVRIGVRGYAQSGAWLWSHRYPELNDPSRYLTADRELGPMRSYAVLLALTVPVDDVLLDARLEGIRWEYPEFDLLPVRHGLSLIVGLTWRPALSL